MLDSSTYNAAFLTECSKRYPPIDIVEETMGFVLAESKLLDAARVLACPVKANPPNWQHGRLLFALARRYLEELLAKKDFGHVTMLDIGTAKGFSALCLRWALDSAGLHGDTVISVDVIDPLERVQRNTIAEVDGYKTLYEIIGPWHESKRIQFRKSTGTEVLMAFPAKARVHFAFIDGKHSYNDVKADALLLSQLQRPGDMAVFDDYHLPGVERAVNELEHRYELNRVRILPNRAYAIAVRK